ncbi:MAG: ABC transporter permease [Trueperaceae bacterium]
MKRIQTLLAVLSVAIGVAAFGAIVGVREWQLQQVRNLAIDFAPNVLVVRFNPPPGFVIESGQNYSITYDEAMALADLPGVESVAYIGGASVRLGGNLRVTMIPASDRIFNVLSMELAAGRALEERDAVIGLPVVVLGSTIAEEMFGSSDGAVGELIDTGGGSMYRVVGVLEPVPEAVAEFQRLNVAALHPVSPGLGGPSSGTRPAGSQAYVRFGAGQEALARRSVADAVAQLPIGAATEVVGADVWLGSQAVFRNQVADELNRGSTWVVVLALIATIGNLANALGLRAVDRAKELAVSRALGATAARAAGRVVADGLLVGGAGTLLGLALMPIAVRLVGVGIDGAGVTAVAVLYTAACGVAISTLGALVPALWMLTLPIYKALREQLSPPVWDGIALTGMAAGALALVVASAIGLGTSDWFQKRLTEIGGNRLVLSTAALGARTSAFAPPPLDSVDAAAVAAVPGVANFAVSYAENTSLILEEGATPVAGYRVDPEFFDIFPRPIMAGRAPVTATETIIGVRIAEMSFPGLSPEEVIGHTLQLGSAARFGAVDDASAVKVVGVYASQPVVSIGDLYDSVIVRLRDPGAPVGGAMVTDFHMVVAPSADFSRVKAAIAEVIDERHSGQFAPAVVHEPAGDLSAARTAMANVAAAWTVIAWLSFVIGGAGLATIVSVRLLRSRPEHALKRSVGATVNRIAGESTVAALRISFGAALVGVVVAAGVCYWVATLAPWDFSVPVAPALIAVGVSLAVGLLAVLLPVIALSRFSPWSVLRSE